jgi:hypothetical protein
MTDKEKSKLQKDILNSLEMGHSGRFLLAPRIGKSKLIIDLIKRDKIKGKILWVTPTTKLATEDIPSEFIKWKAKKYLSQLEAVTWKGLVNIEGEYGLIILDEEQFMTANNSKTLFNGKLIGDVIISMTGTESKSKVKKDLYNKLDLEVKYEININKAVDIGLLSNYRIKVIMVDLDDKKNIEVKYKDKKTKKEKSFMTSEESQYNYLSDKLSKATTKYGIMHRRQVIGNSPSKLGAARYIFNSLEGKNIVFAVSMKQAEDLCDFVYHGKTDDADLKKFIAGETNKIAMVNKGGTGYTYTIIDNLLLTQIDSDVNGLTSQKIARTLLKQGDYEATIWITCLRGTQDQIWLASTLMNFDPSKIEYINFKDLVL